MHLGTSKREWVIIDTRAKGPRVVKRKVGILSKKLFMFCNIIRFVKKCFDTLLN